MQQVVTDQECMTYFVGEQRWRCFMAQYVAAFVRTPLYVLNSYYDTWQLDNILHLDCKYVFCVCIHPEGCGDASQSVEST
jgi:hypothetical protein